MRPKQHGSTNTIDIESTLERMISGHVGNCELTDADLSWLASYLNRGWLYRLLGRQKAQQLRRQLARCPACQVRAQAIGERQYRFAEEIRRELGTALDGIVL